MIVVSHDRYFMDKVVDHLLVFHGDGKIKDFPGNYTQYREVQTLETKAQAQQKNTAKVVEQPKKDYHNDPRRRLSFKEKMEFQQLEKDIESLENEKAKIEEELCSGALSVEELTAKSIRLPQINDAIEEKTMRWLELSEFA